MNSASKVMNKGVNGDVGGGLSWLSRAITNAKAPQVEENMNSQAAAVRLIVGGISYLPLHLALCPM